MKTEGKNWVKIGDVCEQVGTVNLLRADKDGFFLYIDISGVDRERKCITAPTRIANHEAPSRARQLAKRDDVLISTVRPNLNAVAKINLDECIASTGFCVLRPIRKLLDANFLFHWVKTPSFVGDMTDKATGATYPAVSDRIIKASQIPLPPLPEQRRLASILDSADQVRRLRAQTLEKLDELVAALFLDSFGDPANNPKGWPIRTLGELGELDRGISKHRPRDEPTLFGGDYPFIQTGDVANSGGYVRKYTRTYSDKGLSQSKLWKSGTLCITIAANIAKTGMLTFDACFPDSVVGFASGASHESHPEFVRVWFSFVQQRLEDMAPNSAQKNINLKILRELPIIAPPLSLQQQFAARVEAIEAVKARAREAQVESDALFLSLQERAFSGVL